MTNIAFRLLLTFNATSLLLIIFTVHKGVVFGDLFSEYNWLIQLPNIASYLVYLLVPILFTWLSLLLSTFLGKDDFKKGEVESIEHANNSFLPSYLGYFFVALSINNWETLWVVYTILFTFTFLSQALYFNPLFLIFRYEFYNITTKNGTAIFLISAHQYKSPSEVSIPIAYRINNYTFIER
jgi:hypothetical protein